MKPIDQPVEGSHPPKEDVPDRPATSANAGEAKGDPGDVKSGMEADEDPGQV